jgi:hypothetical protein
MQRLMLGLNAFGIKARRHRFDALAVAVEQQTDAIGPRRAAIGSMLLRSPSSSRPMQ